jgi:hypothetical protein
LDKSSHKNYSTNIIYFTITDEILWSNVFWKPYWLTLKWIVPVARSRNWYALESLLQNWRPLLQLDRALSSRHSLWEFVSKLKSALTTR